jgi:hypothetical protein
MAQNFIFFKSLSFFLYNNIASMYLKFKLWENNETRAFPEKRSMYLIFYVNYSRWYICISYGLTEVESCATHTNIERCAGFTSPRCTSYLRDSRINIIVNDGHCTLSYTQFLFWLCFLDNHGWFLVWVRVSDVLTFSSKLPERFITQIAVDQICLETFLHLKNNNL